MSKKKRVRKIALLLTFSVASLGLLGITTTQLNGTQSGLKELEEMDKELISMKETISMKDAVPDSNLVDSITKFLQTKSEEKDYPIIGKFIEGDYTNVNGVYAYAGKVETLDDGVVINTGLSIIKVPEPKFESYSSFTDTVVKVGKGDSGLTLVTYKNNAITRVEFYKLKPKFNVLLASVAKADFPTEDNKTDGTISSTEDTYSNLEADDWKVMTSMISREINGRDLAPVFIVPNVDQSVGKEIDGTFYYLVLGEVVSSDGTNTKLKTYEGKNITIDIPIKDAEQFTGHPSLLHIVTNDSKVESVEVQLFKDASLIAMSEGIMAHIQSVVQP